VHGRGGCGRDIKAAISVERQALRNKLEDSDRLEAGLTKLLLAGISAVVVWGVVYPTCVWQLGSHSLGGWVLEVLLFVWRVVVLLLGTVLWRPPSWYPLQVRGYGCRERMGTDAVQCRMGIDAKDANRCMQWHGMGKCLPLVIER
jgi:hypothetical protein